MLTTTLDKPIALGRTAEIYAWQYNQVVKLFFDWYGLESIQYEQRIAQAVQATGLPVPAVGEILRMNNRFGLVFQRVNGSTMNGMLKRRPWRMDHYARQMAALHAQLHTSTIQADIPYQRQRLVDKIQDASNLPDHLRSRALAALKSMPDGDRLCHGDFHPGNILLTPQGEIIIDWTDATCGNPLSDLARTSILILGSTGRSQGGNLLEKAFVKGFHGEYIRHYFKLLPGGEREYQRWLPIVAAARLSENIPEFERWLIAQVEILIEE